MPISGYTLDTGALIAIERRDARMRQLLVGAEQRNWPISVPAGVLAQVWRDPGRQVHLARFVTAKSRRSTRRRVDVIVLDEAAAREAGRLCGLAGTADIVDASVALCAARRRQAVVTSDPHDLRRLLLQLSDPPPLLRV